MSFENVAVPFKTHGNRQVLCEEQLQTAKWLRDFVDAFPRCFEFDERNSLWIYYPDGDAPCTNPGAAQIQQTVEK